MQTPKFKIGQEVFFMSFEEAKKGTIKGIVAIQGEATLGDYSKTKYNVPEGETEFAYSVSEQYSLIEEDKLFATREDLIQHVIKSL